MSHDGLIWTEATTGREAGDFPAPADIPYHDADERIFTARDLARWQEKIKDLEQQLELASSLIEELSDTMLQKRVWLKLWPELNLAVNTWLLCQKEGKRE